MLVCIESDDDVEKVLELDFENLEKGSHIEIDVLLAAFVGIFLPRSNFDTCCFDTHSRFVVV